MTLAISKLDGHGLNKTVHDEHLQEDKGNTVLVTEGTLDSSNKMECFSYKGEQVNV